MFAIDYSKIIKTAPKLAATCRYGLYATVAGLLTGLCFVIPNLAFLGWVVMTPFFYALLSLKSAKSGFKCGFVFGLSCYLVVLSWLFSMQPLGEMNIVASLLLLALGWLLLGGFLAFFVGLLGAATAWLKLGLGLKIVFLVVGWFIVEWCQSMVLGGFPWAVLGVSQYKYPFLIAGASLWGASGLSCILVACNCLFAASLLKPKAWSIILAVSILGLNLLSGWMMISNNQTTNCQTINGAVLHSNNDLEKRWDDNSSNQILNSYLASAQAAADYWQSKGQQMDLALLPETAVPYSISTDTNLGRAYLQLSKDTKSAIVAGGYDYWADKGYNSLFLIDAQDLKTPVKPIYYKQRLVPFGEYTPLAGFLTSVLPNSFFQAFPISDLTAGEEQGAIRASFGKLGALICYDSIFSHLLNLPIEEGAQFLAVSSNEGWYAVSSALHQGLAHTVLRAVETNRYVLRSTNGGYSAIVNNQGRIVAMASPNDGSGYRFLAAEIPLINGQTVFSHFGSYYIYGFAALLLILLLFNYKKSRQL